VREEVNGPAMAMKKKTPTKKKAPTRKTSAKKKK
jgi:hypothetical protein